MVACIVEQEIREKLSAEIKIRIDREDGFKCALWCANIYRACLAYDPGLGFRKYKNDQERVSSIGSQFDVARAVLATVRKLDWKPIKPEAAKVGDFGIVRTAKGIICVIKDLDLWVTKTSKGFDTFPDNLISRAYRIKLHGN